MAEQDSGTLNHDRDGYFTLSFVRRLARRAEDVWPIVSSAKGLGLWLADAEIDLRSGGRFELFDPCRVEGVVLSAREPHRLEWTWPHPLHPDSIVEISLTTTATGCDLELAQTLLPRSVLLDVATGWHTHLDALPGALRGKRTAFNEERAAHHWRVYETLFHSDESYRHA